MTPNFQLWLRNLSRWPFYFNWKGIQMTLTWKILLETLSGWSSCTYCLAEFVFTFSGLFSVVWETCFQIPLHFFLGYKLFSILNACWHCLILYLLWMQCQLPLNPYQIFTILIFKSGMLFHFHWALTGLLKQHFNCGNQEMHVSDSWILGLNS